MGYYQGVGSCVACGRLFAFNPLRVPSYEGKPICESCITIVNARRRQSGLPEWPVFDDSYEAIEEGEL